MPKPKRQKLIIDHGDYFAVELSKGYFCKIDKDDLCKIDYCNWHYDMSYTNLQGYARSTTMHNKKFMHRVIMGERKGFEIDHINGDTLDNRKNNLRFCTRTENQRNKNHVGVSYHKPSKKWFSFIGIPNRKNSLFLGAYDEKIEAMKVRYAAEQIIDPVFYKNKGYKLSDSHFEKAKSVLVKYQDDIGIVID